MEYISNNLGGKLVRGEIDRNTVFTVNFLKKDKVKITDSMKNSVTFNKDAFKLFSEFMFLQLKDNIGVHLND